jgi:hypothetical protein
MRRSTTFILGPLTAILLAACNAPRSGNTAGGGSETGSMRSDTAMGVDTTMGGMRDTTHKDTTAR